MHNIRKMNIVMPKNKIITIMVITIKLIVSMVTIINYQIKKKISKMDLIIISLK